MKTAIIIPYIGKFNNYFSLFLSSCIHNPLVDFFFFTDDMSYAKNVMSSNIHFIYTKFSDLKRRAQNLFDFKIALDYPYKLCDFRPCYGLMFADYLEGYDYWGHCDTDMIFGDIISFLNDAMTKKYKRILRHGHLSLYHNDSYTNNIFKEFCVSKKIGFQDVLSCNTSFAFDEAGGTTLIWFQNHPDELYDNLALFRNPNCYVKSFKYVHNKELFPLRYYLFDNGKLYDCHIENGKEKKEEILYLHLFHRKMKVEKGIGESRFLIVPNKFINYRILTGLNRFLLCYKPIYLEFWYQRAKVVIKRYI